MKKVLLFHPRTGHEKNYKNFWIPYSVLSIGSELINSGRDVSIWDNNLDKNSFNQLEKKIEEIGEPILVGISSMIGYQIKEGLQFASLVRKIYPNIPIVWGGTAPTILPQQFADSSLVDIVVRGQGELVIKDILSGNKSRIQHKEQVSRENFASYSFKLVPVERYIKPDEHINKRTINYISSQGCPFGCGFCTEVALYHQRWYAQSRENIRRKINQLINEFNVNGIKFYDANFFVNKRRVLGFAQDILDKGLDIRWAASAHPNNLLNLNDKELELIRKSGCSRILVGAESGNQEELNYIHKNTTIEKVLKVAKKLRKNDICGSFTIIVGYPGFPDKNISKTLEFGKRIATISSLHEVKAHVYAPYPGTPLYQDAIRHGFVAPKTLKDWADYDYYEVQTPWLKSELTQEVREFNRSLCPYVL